MRGGHYLVTSFRVLRRGRVVRQHQIPLGVNRRGERGHALVRYKRGRRVAPVAVSLKRRNAGETAVRARARPREALSRGSQEIINASIFF